MWEADLAELHDDVHHVALLVALIVLDNVGVVQAVQHLHLILGLRNTDTCHHSALQCSAVHSTGISVC